MIFALISVLILTSPFTLWLFVIRRYCLRNGMGYTPGAAWDVTMWIDWQEASEMAAQRKDRGMILWCRLFLAIKLLFSAVGLLVLAAGLAGM